jgi:hypothetical protein
MHWPRGLLHNDGMHTRTRITHDLPCTCTYWPCVGAYYVIRCNGVISLALAAHRLTGNRAHVCGGAQHSMVIVLRRNKPDSLCGCHQVGNIVGERPKVEASILHHNMSLKTSASAVSAAPNVRKRRSGRTYVISNLRQYAQESGTSRHDF